MVVHSRREKVPELAESLLLPQKSSDVKSEKLEKVVKRHSQKPGNESGHKFEKKLYKEQHDFNLKAPHHLQNVA